MKLALSFLLIFLSLNSFGQAKSTISISGTISKMADDTVLLDNGNHAPIKIAVNKAGAFNIKLKADSGSYYIFNNSIIYLAPQMDLVINKQDTTLTFTGKGSVENNLYKEVNASVKKYLPFQYAELFNKVIDVEPADFIKQMDEYKLNALKLIADNKGLDKYFVKTQKESIEYITRWSIFMYTLKYGVDPAMEKEQRNLILGSNAATLKDNMPKIMDLSNKMHVKRMSLADNSMVQAKVWEDFNIDDSDLYKFSQSYRSLLDMKISQLLNAEYIKSPYLRGKNQNEIKFDIITREIKNDYIKQRVLYNIMRLLLKPDADLDKNYAKYLSASTDNYYKSDIEAGYNRLKLFHPGAKAPEFVYKDIHDKPVALSSLAGSYVYIDVWATWCGPCIAEIPALKFIENKYSQKSIKFVSISVDKKADIDKWKKFVSDNQLDGVQVITENDVKSNFIKDFDINSIPRFILIDPEGKIVSANALRPSNAQLQTLLDKLLN